MKKFIAGILVIGVTGSNLGCGPYNYGPCIVSSTEVRVDKEETRRDVLITTKDKSTTYRVPGFTEEQFNQYSKPGTEYKGPISSDIYCD